MYKNFEYDIFRVIRPLPLTIKRENNGMPIITKTIINNINDLLFTTFTNTKSIKHKDKSIVLMFEYDKSLNRIWNDPTKYIPKFSDFHAVCTPDFSIYGEMDYLTIVHNTYKNRWIGCYYQSQGLNVIPTISWCGEDTYDICFSGVEKGSAIAISTIGSRGKEKVFLKGFNEMIKRLEPSLIIVKGRWIEGMHGNIKLVKFEDTFFKNGGEKKWAVELAI